jgi:hypothetical protein
MPSTPPFTCIPGNANGNTGFVNGTCKPKWRRPNGFGHFQLITPLYCPFRSLRRKDRPIILFTKIELDPYSPSGDIFYSREQLSCSYEWTTQLGADGLVVWSTSNRMRQRCQPIADYLDQFFGPFIWELRERTEELGAFL